MESQDSMVGLSELVHRETRGRFRVSVVPLPIQDLIFREAVIVELGAVEPPNNVVGWRVLTYSMKEVTQTPQAPQGQIQSWRTERIEKAVEELIAAHDTGKPLTQLTYTSGTLNMDG